MSETIKLTMKNVGPIKSADIEIDGITVIAGTNGSGKTSIGKLLYVLGKTYSMAGYKTANINIIENISKLIKDDIFSNYKLTANIKEQIETIVLDDIKTLSQKQDDIKNKHLNIIEVIKKNYKDSYKEVNNDELYDNITTHLKLKENYTYLLKEFEKQYLSKEFNGHLKNVNSNDYSYKSTIDNSNLNDVVLMGVNNFLNIKEDSLVKNHKEDFSTRVKKQVEENAGYNVIEKDKLDKIMSMITEMLNDGEFYFDDLEDDFIYKDKNSNKFKMINTANGIQTLGYFTRLLNLDFVTKNNLLILDEPETSLHPKWQTKFANALITLNKEFGLKIVVLSHSPYFINAIEDLAKINDVNPDFYLLNETAVDSGEFVSKKVDSVGDIYECLDEGFSDVDNILIEKRHADKKN